MILMLALFLLGTLGKVGLGLGAIVFFAVASLYPILFEVYWNGQSPGKRLSGLRVLRDDGTPVDWSAATARNLLRFVDALPVGYATALAAIWINPDGKRLGDILAGTVVTYCAAHDTANGKAKPAASQGPGIPEAPPFPLTQAEQQALLEFHQRAPLLTEERAEELAQLAEPLAAGLDGGAARARLVRLAEYQMGAASREKP